MDNAVNHHEGRSATSRTGLLRVVTVAAWLVAATAAQAQPPVIRRLTFQQAVDQAMRSNPNVGQAAAGIMRAEAILQQVRASSFPSLGATFATNVIGPVPEFSGAGIVPRTQTQTVVTLAAPLLAPVAWAQRAVAADQVFVSQQTEVDVRRQIAIATAQTFLAIIANRRVLDLNVRLRDNAKAHYDYANERLQGGLGSRLNMLRALQEVTADEVRVEDATLAIRRTQEALGVLVNADGPVDAADEPIFDASAEDVNIAAPVTPADFSMRADIKLLEARQAAAEHAVNLSWRDNLPSMTATFAPQMLAPAGLFATSRSWRTTFMFSIPVLDGGFRSGMKHEREALLNTVKFERAAVEKQAGSEVRSARDAVASNERALASARMAADQANEVVQITDVAFREGATTNIEVLDAQRQARDAETQAAIAEDALRRARLDLLVALGRFPQ
jgi:outer membrane protein TolC